MLILLISSLVILSCYVLLMLFFLTGLMGLRDSGEGGFDPGPELTVIIPFRNEEDNLPGIISDLKAQDYPERLFSVVLVNDHSDDGSLDVLSSMMEGLSSYSCLNLPDGTQGKKKAIAFALDRVKSPWILQTDADCRLGPGFISSHMRFMEASSSDMAGGMVTTMEERGGFLEAFERLDLLSLNGSGAGSFHWGRAIMCSGANLVYKKDLYHETRDFDPTGKTGSGDDMFLLIGARKSGKRLGFNPDRDSLVRTKPAESLAEVIRQRIRWGAKSAHYGKWDIQLVAITVAVVNLLVFFSPLILILLPDSCLWILSGIGIKMLVDFLVLAVTCRKTGQLATLRWFIPVSLVYPPYMTFVIAGSLFSSPGWKGRKVQDSLLR